MAVTKDYKVDLQLALNDLLLNQDAESVCERQTSWKNKSDSHNLIITPQIMSSRQHDKLSSHTTILMIMIPTVGL